VLGGGPDFESEVAKVIEFGYRAQPLSTLSWSATAYYSRYDKLRTQEPLTSPTAPALSEFQNMGEGSMRGIEMWGTWQAAPVWRLNAGLGLQHVRTDLLPGSRDLSSVNGNLTTNDPSQRWMLRSSYDLTDNSAAGSDLALHGRVAAAGGAVVLRAGRAVDVETSAEYRCGADRTQSAASFHPEFAADPGRSVFERSVLLKLTLRF
jgi:iron complex outermembrane receptor protein